MNLFLYGCYSEEEERSPSPFLRVYMLQHIPVVRPTVKSMKIGYKIRWNYIQALLLRPQFGPPDNTPHIRVDLIAGCFISKKHCSPMISRARCCDDFFCLGGKKVIYDWMREGITAIKKWGTWNTVFLPLIVLLTRFPFHWIDFTLNPKLLLSPSVLWRDEIEL